MAINFLPPEEQKQIFFERNRVYLMRFLLIAYVGIAFASGGLFLMRMYSSAILVLEANRVAVQQFDPELSAFYSVRSTVEEAGKSAEKILVKKQEERDVAAMIRDLQKLVPNGVVLKSITFSDKDDTVGITGFSPTREQFLSFLKNAKGAFFLKDVQSPLANLLSPEDVTFTITLFLK